MGSGESKEGLGKSTVLVVDDDERIRKVAVAILTRAGFECLTACNGVEAIAVYKERGRDIHCVLLDMSMPRMGGAEAFDELKELNADVRVLFSSGFLESEMPVAKGGGKVGVIQKPYRMATLVEEVNSLIDR